MANKCLYSNKNALISARSSWELSSTVQLWDVLCLVTANCPAELSEKCAGDSNKDELVFLEQPQDNGADYPCVLHFQCTPQGGREIAFLQVVSEARIIEVYSDTEYCGTCRGDKVSSFQINGVNENISLYKKRVHLECPVTSCEVKLLSLGRKNRVGINSVLLGVKPVKTLASFPSGGTSIDLERVQTMVESMGTKLSPGAQHLMDMVQFQQKNQQDNLGGFLGLLMGNRQFPALGKENARSRPTPNFNEQTEEDELAGGSLDHNSASSLEAEVTAGKVLTTESFQCPFEVENKVSPANQITDMVSSYLHNQTEQKQNTTGVDMLPFLQSVCGQVKQLRIEDGAQKSEAVQRRKPSPELQKEHMCCSSLEKVLVKQMELMESRLMHCIDQRLNALEDSLERKVQSALDIIRRADDPKTVKQDCGCHGALVNGNA
ncbi:ATPase PAAT [Polyodon spathula]|uniref:ATPase PAAT n=1 Tax=Polyodon spathula TaxID=7913 RepID=UPI001B7DF6A6|nr:ATPase PAAT [Polyodon spathula]